MNTVTGMAAYKSLDYATVEMRILMNANRDETEDLRRFLTDIINSRRAERKELEAEYGKVWDTEELKRDFDVEGFLAPFCSVVRKSDGVRGALVFQHVPRYYFDFVEIDVIER